MALPTSPTYSTHQEFKDHTQVASQQEIEANEWKRYALKAERVLDTFVNIRSEQKYDPDQILKFPIKDSDGNSYLPDEVKLAHIEITSDLILKGDITAYDGLMITNEQWNGTGYSVTKAKKASASSDDLKIEIPPYARRLLMQWTSKVFRLTY